MRAYVSGPRAWVVRLSRDFDSTPSDLVALGFLFLLMVAMLPLWLPLAGLGWLVRRIGEEVGRG